ncbi:unnamed protein product [Moneuplotes crassus]|uniref:Uncharacterized protein n=1 Tax=Euplotes crassus TaxID=5936 RepID=A0AAD1XX21_EUPCR|nr:unnamed protein product [Moneuplotes crassus]
MVMLLNVVLTRTTYSRRSSTSYRSGSSSTGSCTGGTSTCVIIPIVCVLGFFGCICGLIVTAHVVKAIKKKKEQDLRDKVRLEKKRKEELERRQKEEASRLEKLQKQQEEQMKNQLFINQTDYSITPQPQAQFVMPGTAVQPTYQITNPYAGNHNYQPVPVVYDPAVYGVQYDENWQVPDQNLMYTGSHPMASMSNFPQDGQKNVDQTKVVPYETNETARGLA